MRPNRLRQLLKQGKPTLSTHILSTWPSIVEAVGHTGYYDYVEFVAEYAPFDLYDLDNLARAAQVHDLSMMIKVDQEPRGFISQRAIGAGFDSVLFADCRSVDDVQACVRAARPDTPDDLGSYGVSSRRFAFMGYGGSADYVTALNDVVVAIMVEKKGTVEVLEEVLSVAGVDMIQWGGVDYAMSVGKAGQRGSPEIKAVEKRVVQTALRMGVPPRAEILTADDAKYYLDLGVRHFCVGTDLSVLHQWWREQGDAMRKTLSDA